MRNPLQDCLPCKKRMAKLETRFPRLARVVRPLHERIVGVREPTQADVDARRVLGRTRPK